MKTSTALRALALTAAVAGCTVGTGSGVAQGPLWIADCWGEANTDAGPGAPAPRLYDLRPSFFAGEPIEDVRRSRQSHRLLVRLQRTGGRIETTDSLVFDFVNSYEVARCLRGRLVAMPDGTVVPDYDETSCYWAPGADRPIMKVGDLEHVRAYLMLNTTCTPDPTQPRTVVGVAVSSPPRTPAPSDGTWTSWIKLVQFGSVAAARMPDRTQRPPVGTDYKVEFNERVWADSFEVTLEDDRVLYAQRERLPVPAPEIAGTLTGRFDFDLERSRAAQTFP